MSHLLAVGFAVVRQHVTDQESTSKSKNARRLGEGFGGIRQVVQNEEQRRSVERSILNRQRLELAAPDVDVGEIADALSRRVEHVGRSIDRDHLLDEGREGRGHLAGPASEVADDPLRVEQSGQRVQIRGAAEEVLAKAVPLPRRRSEEFLRLALPASEHAAEPPGVLVGAGGQAHLLAEECPESPSRGPAVVERERVVAARAVPSRGDPSGIEERLEVTADRGLRQLEDGAELGDRQLVALEHHQHAAASRIGQRRQVVKDCRFHPYIRMKCCINRPVKSRAGTN